MRRRTLRVQMTGQSVSFREGVDVVLPRRQELPEVEALVFARLANAEQFQEIDYAGILHHARSVRTVIRKTLDRIFGVVVVPGNAIVVKECKKFVSILEKPLTQCLGGLGSRR